MDFGENQRVFVLVHEGERPHSTKIISKEMLSSIPRLRSSILSSSVSTLRCKSLTSSLSRYPLLSSLSTLSSQSTSLPSFPLHTFNGVVGTGRHCSQCSKSGRSYIQQKILNNQYSSISRQFSSDSPDGGKPSGGKQTKKKDLRESIERLKSFDSESSSRDSAGFSNEKNAPPDDINPYVEKVSSIATSFLRSLAQTWDDLIASGQAKDINKKLSTPTDTDDKPNYSNDDEAADKYEKYKGSKDIMVIDPQEHLSAWERMERRLRDAPIIQGERHLFVFTHV